MLIGGAGSDRGVIGGLAILLGFRLGTRFLNEQLPFVTADQFASLRLILVGLLLVAVIRYRPEGIWGNAEELGVDS
jgi:branched-chain amino acid transport system permease protein